MPIVRRTTLVSGVGVLASVVDQAATAAASFMASVVLGRYGGVDALGLFAISNVVFLLYRSIHSGLVLEPMSVLGSRRDRNEMSTYSYFLVAYGLTMTCAGAVFGVLLSLSAYALGYIDRHMLLALCGSLAFTNIYCLQMLLRAKFYMDQQPLRAAVQSLSYISLSALGFIIAILTSSVSAPNVYVILSACSAATCLFQWRLALADIHIVPIRVLRQHIREHWQYGRWILPTIPLGLATSQGYYVLVGVFLSKEAAGFLKAAETLVAPFSQIVIAMYLLILPIVARRIDLQSVKEQMANAIKLALILFGLAATYAIAVVAFAKGILQLLFGEVVEHSLPLAYVLIVLPITAAVALPASITLSSLMKPKLRFYSLAIGAFASMCVGIPLMVLFNLYGATVGMVVGQSASTFSLWLFLFIEWHRSLHAPVPRQTCDRQRR